MTPAPQIATCIGFASSTPAFATPGLPQRPQCMADPWIPTGRCADADVTGYWQRPGNIMDAMSGRDGAAETDSPYAWRRLACTTLISTIGGVGMWSFIVALPSVQADFGITRADASMPYTLLML